jgi:hypothetical protein
MAKALAQPLVHPLEQWPMLVIQVSPPWAHQLYLLWLMAKSQVHQVLQE